MNLLFEFTEKMKKLFEENEYNEFISSLSDKKRYYGLRINTLKISVDDFLKISPFELKKIPWTDDGFYYNEGVSPGKHPYYHAGLYYIQEPSAMLPGKVINAQEGERILDLCAAPGGKSVQIAAGMKGNGFLLCNDINSDRVKALVKNIELSGVRNAIVTNDAPEKLSLKFENYFDKVLVDAPCSGEGMFRKDEDAIKSWGKYKCDMCTDMQWNILQNADKMLKPGGFLVYSTCTFSPEENELMLERFINATQNYDFIEIPKIGGVEGGRPCWAGGNEEALKAARLWPHKLEGEGHFVALLKKRGNEEDNCTVLKGAFPADNINAPEQFKEFEEKNLNIKPKGYFSKKGNNLYITPFQMLDLSGIKIAKFGLYLGEIKEKRFEPSHSFILSLKKEHIKNTINLSSKSSEIIKYLKGETLLTEGVKGFVGVCVDGFTIGWGKQTPEGLKNLYPKGWRRMN